jgi:PAS domain S-box-containing protein
MTDTSLNEGGAADDPKVRWSQHCVSLVLRGLLVSVAYYFGSLLGYALIFPSSYISIIWPPNAVLLVALLLSPRWQWPWLLLIPLPFHLLVQSQFGVSLTAALLYYVFDCFIVPLTATALCRVGVGELVLGDMRQALAFIAGTTIAVAVGTLIWSPLIVSLWIGGNLWTAWYLTFLSNYLPFLIATPGLVIGLRHGADIRNASPARCTEFALLALGLLACAVAVFGLAPRAVEDVPALFYAPLPFLLWAAVRFGPGGLSFAFLIFALLAIFDAVAGHGPFVTPSAGAGVVSLQVFLLALYVPLLVLASVVAERRSKEVDLRESEAHYRAVVEDQTELVCRFLPDGTFTFVNGAYCQYFQRSREELLGRTFWTLIPLEGHKEAREFLASITPDNPVATREHEVLAADGELRWQQWRDRGFFDEHRRVVEYQAVGRDITDRKRAEEAMHGLAHAARLALAGELMGSIAHEINQPLGAILTNAEAAELLLESESPPLEEIRKIFTDIRKDDLRASAVIRRIRTLLRKREMRLVPLDLNELVGEVMGLVLPDARRRGVALETQLASGLPAVLGDRVCLQQVLLNLLLNGMDAMIDTPQEERRIVVCTQRTGEKSVSVSVSDKGHGIPPGWQSKIFESFLTTKEHGMGLGLAIARSLIDAHGGRIWAENNENGGATFRFNLPTEVLQPDKVSSESPRMSVALTK